MPLDRAKEMLMDNMHDHHHHGHDHDPLGNGQAGNVVRGRSAA
jgi:hypothetical protein